MQHIQKYANKEELQRVADDFKKQSQDSIDSISKGEVRQKDVRFVVPLLLTVFGVIGLILPGLFTFIAGGGWGNATSEADLVRYLSIFMIGFGAIFYRSAAWKDHSQQQLFRVVFLMFTGLFVVNTLNLMTGSVRFFAVLGLPIAGVIAFYTGSMGGLY
eukprot:gb/GECH01011554.1/.p1 GENE.gb/GECH01011554.1/~~gb/GECH01011554.1/.p1  ORF type:complete len:159 (+),score=42.56 gb/GECH01011554.1/:1-477(+)